MDIATTGVQIHGGMGYVEETGAAQYLRDARITTIYEGTTGIQAADLIGRKVAFEKGETAFAVIGEMRRLDVLLAKDGNEFAAMRANLKEAVDSLEEATHWLVETFPKNAKAAFGVSVPYLKLFGTVAGGWHDGARCARRAGQSSRNADARPGFPGRANSPPRASTPSTSCRKRLR